MTINYKPRGVCSQMMEVTVENGIVAKVVITGGCDGNLQGISHLVVGMPADEAVRRMRGIRCGRKATSCPDQLSAAIEACAEAERRG